MAVRRYLTRDPVTGRRLLKSALDASAGAGSAGEIVALNPDGKLDETMMPSGLGAETVQCPASENLASGDQVNLWMDAGTMKARKADATAVGKESDGFVKSAVPVSATAAVYLPGVRITGLTDLTPDADYFLATTPGGITDEPPNTVGNVIQKVGKALSTTELYYNPGEPEELG